MAKHRALPRWAVVKRQAFLEKRLQSVSAYVAWAHDPGLSAVTTQKTGGPWWMATAKNWMARRRNRQNSVYLHSSIEAAAASFRQLVEASRALVDDLTAGAGARCAGSVSRFERTHQPARNLLGRCNRQRHELAAGRLRARSRTAPSAPGRGACHSLLASLASRRGEGQSSTGALPA